MKPADSKEATAGDPQSRATRGSVSTTAGSVSLRDGSIPAAGSCTVTAWAICLGVLGGNYTVLTWLPTFLQSEHGLSYASTGAILLVNILGSFIGYNVGGGVSDRLGRRGALRLFVTPAGRPKAEIELMMFCAA